MPALLPTVAAVVAIWLSPAARAGSPVALDNGARLVVEPIPGTGAVAVIAAYATGFADDPAGLAQAAHLAEHLRVTAGDPDALAHGVNAETLASLTYYDYALTPDGLERAFRTEARRLLNTNFTDADVAREVPRVRAEVDVVAASPGLFVGKFAAMAAAQVWRHGAEVAPVRLPEPPDAATMRAFVEAEHRIDRLTIVVIGDADPEQAEALFRAHFGDLAPSAAAAAVGEPDFLGLPAMARVAWDVPAKVVLVALPGADAGCRAELEALAARAGFALNQHAAVRSIVHSGPGLASGPLPLFVGACLSPDADEHAALKLLHEALDAAAESTPAQARATAGFLSPVQATPSAEAVRAMAGQVALQRGLTPQAAAALVMGNHALQNSLLRRPMAQADDETLARAIPAAFARDNRRALVLAPGSAN